MSDTLPSSAAFEAISADVCVRMVEVATRSCHALVQAQPASAQSPGISAADSLAALSNSFAFGSLLLAVIVLVGGFSWGKIIAASAKEEATQAAAKLAEQRIEDWLAKEAPRIVRTQVDLILNATLGSGDDADAADRLGKEAG